ncbi:MAG: M20 family metallopeptidase [candidate division Zixibacteria bacterium]|nr:M20 family metallopeptidase [candidate division Zixibacteria bacterium]
MLNSLKDELLERVRKLHRQQVTWRRDFHQHPELSSREFRTTARLTAIVKKLGLKLIPIKMKTGLLAELAGNHPGPTVAIRTDIDALPVTERSGLPFASKVNGCMHACGHDVHMAIVLGTAAVLSKMKKHIHGRVRFIFQPDEEMPPGGARPMIENGAVDGVSAVFGLHVDPMLPAGMISTRDGISMAMVTDFDLVIHGKGGHAASPHSGVDAIVTAAEVIESIQKIVSREISPTSPIVIHFGRIEGGTGRNIVADRVTLDGTARALSDTAGRLVPKLIKRTVSGVCRARGARAEVNIGPGYPPLRNDPAVNRIFENNYRLLYGRGKIRTTKQVLGAEDFACYLEKVPGAMFFLGIRNRKIKADKAWHSSDFIADERAIEYGTALLASSALDYLAGDQR